MGLRDLYAGEEINRNPFAFIKINNNIWKIILEASFLGYLPVSIIEVYLGADFW